MRKHLGRHSVLVLLSAVSTIAAGSGQAGYSGADPFQRVESETYENGTTVYLVPNDKAENVYINIRYNVGTLTETETNRGAAHLLEHALFTFANAEDDYLHFFKEQKASVNAITDDESTEYYGSVHYKKGEWLIRNFIEMLLERSFSDHIIDKARNVVRIELREKFNDKSELSLVNLLDKVNFFKMPSYWEREFGAEKGPDTSDEIDGNEMLTTEQINDFYRTYYQPSHAVVIVAGRFDPVSVKKILALSFGRQLNTSDVSPVRFRPLKPAKRPYESYTVRSKRNGLLRIGLQFWELSPLDTTILSVYFDDLAERLHKKVRTEEGSTYSVSKIEKNRDGFGFVTVEFEVEAGQMERRTAEVNELIQSELHEGKLSDEVIKSMLERHLDKYNRIENEAYEMYKIAKVLHNLRTKAGERRSPYELTSSLTPQIVRERIRGIIANNSAKYSDREREYFLFSDESLGLLALCLTASFWSIKFFIQQPFQHTGVTYVRKIKYSFLTQLKIFVGGLTFSFFVFSGCEYMIGEFLYATGLRKYLFVNDYLVTLVTTFAGVGVVLMWLASVPRKIIIANGKLHLKSLTYWSRVIDIDEIASVVALRPHQALRHLGLKTRFFHWAIWRRGLLLTLKSGRKYYLGSADSETASKELATKLFQGAANGALDNPKKIPHTEFAA
jgi:zinc protease